MIFWQDTIDDQNRNRKVLVVDSCDIIEDRFWEIHPLVLENLENTT